VRLDAARKEKVRIQSNIKEVLHAHVQQMANRPPSGMWTKNKPAIPLLSVGIAQGSRADGYRVAVRISRHGYRVELLNKVFARHNPDDLHLRYVGRIFPVGVAPVVIQSSGSSVSHYLTGTGSIGCPVRDLQTGGTLLLSNNHVIALENDAIADDPVVDPGKDDGGTVPANTVAHFARCVNLDFSGASNVVDCAVARLAPGVSLAPPGEPGFPYDPSLPPPTVAKTSLVKKLGRSTGLTTGTVTGIEMGGFFVDYQNGPAMFDHQIEVTGVGGAFAAHGDSGSLVINEAGAAVGLLFAVSETGVAYVNPIGPVLDLLGVALT
jgi:hypothetical protein